MNDTNIYGICIPSHIYAHTEIDIPTHDTYSMGRWEKSEGRDRRRKVHTSYVHTVRDGKEEGTGHSR